MRSEKYGFELLFLSLCLCVSQNVTAQAPVKTTETTVVMVRHGEKPEADLGQLACQGLNRALKLANVLHSRYGVADLIFAPNPSVKIQADGVEWSYVRPLTTIEPYAIKIGSPVNADYGWNNLSPVVKRIRQREKGLIVVAWEHHGIVGTSRDLMKAFGANPDDIPVWSGDDFDSMYVFKIEHASDAKQSRITFLHTKEGLNGQSKDCPN